jgi:hypothetical protein
MQFDPAWRLADITFLTPRADAIALHRAPATAERLFREAANYCQPGDAKRHLAAAAALVTRAGPDRLHTPTASNVTLRSLAVNWPYGEDREGRRIERRSTVRETAAMTTSANRTLMAGVWSGRDASLSAAPCRLLQ